MAFPQSPLNLRVQFKFDGTTWTDVSPDVQYEDRITLRAGGTGTGNRVDSTTCTFNLNDPDGHYSPDNPEGQFFPDLGRNTPVRVSVLEGEVALTAETAPVGGAGTDDNPAIDITGDIDVRIEAELWNWVRSGISTADNSIELIGKMRVAPQKSWLLETREGFARFEWSTDGTNNREALSTERLHLPSAASRMVLRATLDVDNGAGGNTVTFYTSDSMSGPWQQLGAPVTQTGVTSISNSNAGLQVRNATQFSRNQQAIGRLYRAEVRSGINGTVVANPDFTLQASGTTSFTDGAGRLWNTQDGAEITNRKILFQGETSSLTPRTKQKKFRYVEVEAGGVMRRNSVARDVFRSAVYRDTTYPSRAEGIVAYWPMEDGNNSDSIASGLAGSGRAMTIAGGINFSSYSTWAASSPLPTFTGGTCVGYIPPHASTNSYTIRTFLAVPSTGIAATRQILSFRTTGTASEWRVYLDSAGGLEIRAYDDDDVQILAPGGVTFNVNGKQRILNVILTQNGSNIDYSLLVFVLEDSTISNITAQTAGGTLNSRTIGAARQLVMGTTADLEGTALGQVTVASVSTAFANSGPALVNYAGEPTTTRMARIDREEGVTITNCGFDNTLQGGQGETDMLTLLRDAAEASGGVLCELKDQLGLAYRSPDSMQSQEPVLDLTYAPGPTGGIIEPFNPVYDDNDRVNDYTAERRGGGSVRVEESSGRMSVADPPLGVGRYPGGDSFNLFHDGQTRSMAQWQLRLGTYEGPRFNKMTIFVEKTPTLIQDVCRAYVGDLIRIRDVPVRFGGGDIDLIINGYTMNIDQYSWSVSYDLSSAEAWRTAVREDDTYGRRDTAGSALTVGVDSTQTDFDVYTATGPRWITTASHPADFPFDAIAGGEAMTVTANTSAALDAFTRSVSNGWGTADVGGAWTADGGAVSQYSVTGTRGRHAVDAVNVTRFTVIPEPGPDTDQKATCRTGALATGGDQRFGLTSRWQPAATDYYLAQAHFTSSATVELTIQKSVGGVVSSIAGSVVVPGLTHVANTDFTIRFKTEGSTLSVKVWLTSGPEPSGWQLGVTDTSVTAAGSAGVRSILGSTNTNALPFSFDYDDYEIMNPQTMTVARSVNSVVKSHAAGSAVSLYKPLHRGL